MVGRRRLHTTSRTSCTSPCFSLCFACSRRGLVSRQVPPTPPPNQTCYKTNWCALQGQAAAFLWSHSLASGARQSRNPRSQLRSRRAESRVHRGTASCHGPESRVYTGIASCHGAESRGTASCHEAWGLRLSKVTMSKKKAHDWLSISRGAR